MPVDRVVHRFKQITCISLLQSNEGFFSYLQVRIQGPERVRTLSRVTKLGRGSAERTGSLFNHSALLPLSLVGKRPHSEARCVPAREPCNLGQMTSLLEPQFAHLQNGRE